MSEHEDAERLLEDWHRRFYTLQNCHYEVARIHRRRNYMMGVPVAVLTALVGGSIFAALEASVSPAVQITVGLLSFVAAALSSVHTFLGYAERAEKNRIAGANYGALRRRAEQELVLPTTDGEKLRALITEIREKSDRYAKESPEIPSRVYEKWKRKEPSRTRPVRPTVDRLD